MLRLRYAIPVLFAVLLVTVNYLYRDHHKNLQEARQAIIREEKVTLDKKALQLEGVFRQLYQGARTISLLPGIRHLQGGNLPKGFADKFKYDRARFSPDMEMTVQQVYNNLAANVSVSEVYCILKGFRPDLGETPFFMFDELIVDRKDENKGEEQKNSDAPEESEEDEYKFYVVQMNDLEKQYPTLPLSKIHIDQIPAASSPEMRTCDNAQYTSKAHGNLRDASGMLFSVPVFDAKEQFRGIISVIVRSNVFEAILLDRPFVVVTDEDKKKAEAEGWSMPTAPARFVLRNKSHNVLISDRRAGEVVKRYQESLNEQRGPGEGDVLHRTLKTPFQTEWELGYVIPGIMFQENMTGIEKLFKIKLVLTFASAIFILLIFISAARKREQISSITGHMGTLAAGELSENVEFKGNAEVKALAQMYRKIVENHSETARIADCIADGDLTVHVKLASERDVLGKAFSRMVEKLGLTIGNVHSASLVVLQESNRIALSSKTLSEGAVKSAEALSQISSSLTEISSQTKMNADHAEKADQLARIARDSAGKGNAQMEDIVRAMGEINSSSERISSIIEVINEIARQTKLLSFNASVEAARAGEHGKGFAVVAEEVRVLADRSAKAADETAKLIQDSIHKVTTGGQAVAGTSASLQEIVRSINEVADLMKVIAAASKEQAQGVEQVNIGAAEIDKIINVTSSTAKSVNDSVEQLIRSLSDVKNAVELFKLPSQS